MKQVQWLMESPVGPIYLVASESHLLGVYWTKAKLPLLASLQGPGPEIQILLRTKKQLEEYFLGKRRDFDLPLDASGTEFQKSVWNQLKKIPYGKTCSYSDIAKRIQNDRAVRAVGTANGRNPLSIVVPCHRVIAANGTLGGYAGGLPVKVMLLEIEKKPS